MVYPDVIFGGDGDVKVDPVHIFVPDIFADLPGISRDKVYEDDGIKQFLKMMTPPYTNGDPEIRKNQIISITFSFSLHYYRFIVDQCGGCPALVIGSYETSTAKTVTTKLALKTVSVGSHFLAQSSSEQSVNSLKAKTSLPFAIDDIENKGIEHKIILSNFNGATKTTIGRGRERPIAGLLLSKNFKENEILEEKDDEGRAFIQIYDKRIDEDVEEAYDAEAEHSDVMEDNVLCRNFLAKMTTKFLKNKGEKSKFQEKHQAACGILGEQKSEYGNRKLKCYALALCSFLLIEEEVEELGDKDVEKRFVEVYKDRATFIDNLLWCLEKTDRLVENHVNRRRANHESLDLDVAPVPYVHDPEATLASVLDLFIGKSIVETTNVVKGFTKKNGEQLIAVAHTKLKKTNPELAKQVKEIKEQVPDIKSGVNTFTKAKAERHIGASNTESKTSIEFPFAILTEEMLARVRNMFDMPTSQQIQSDADSEDDEISQSQDYPGLYQSKGRDTMKFCNLCDFTTRNPTEMEDHARNHPECCFCKKRMKNNEHLENHMKDHETIKCIVCSKDISKEDYNNHRVMHENHQKQMKALDKGKVVKTKSKSKTTGYNVYVKEKFKDIAAQHKDLTNAEIMKKVGSSWKEMTKADKKPYCDLADNGTVAAAPENPVPTNDIPCAWCERTFKSKDQAKKHMTEHISHSSGNQLNRIQPGPNQEHITQCNKCGAMVNRSNIDDHMKNHADAAEEIVDEVDAIEEPVGTDDLEFPESETEEISLEELVNNDDEMVPVVVLVKMRTKFWPAKVTSYSPDSYDVTLCKRGDMLTVEKVRCKPFSPSPDMTKGQSREWKECYRVAVEMLESES